MTGNVELTGRITSPAAEQAEMVPLFEEHARLSRGEPGCLRFEVTPDPRNPEVFAVSEFFIDETAFEAHGARTRASEWGRQSAHLVRKFDRAVLE